MKKNITIGEKYQPAMEILTQEEADTYFEQCVKHTMRHGVEKHTRAEAEKIERGNLGYFAGYYGSETRERVERLFKCSHPIFGSISQNGSPTPTEALASGMIAAKSETKMAAKLFGRNDVFL